MYFNPLIENIIVSFSVIFKILLRLMEVFERRHQSPLFAFNDCMHTSTQHHNITTFPDKHGCNGL